MKHKNYLILFAFIIFLISAALTCDKGTEPEEEPEEHLFYLAPRIGNMVKIFSAEQEKIIDSFVVDSVRESWQMRIHVIGDDSLLAVSSASKTFLVELEQKKIVSSHAYETPIISRNSNYYFDYNHSEVRTYPDNAVAVSETGAIFWAKFCNQSKVVSYVYADSSGEQVWPSLGYADIPMNSTHNHLRYSNGIPVAATFNMAVESLGKLFLATSYPSYEFAVTDFDSDTIRSLKKFGMYATIVPVVGPDDEFVYFSDYGISQTGYSPGEHIYVFDAYTEDSITAIPFQGLDMVDYMIISHDRKYLLARPYNEFEDISAICLIDAVNFELIGAYDCGFLPGSISAKYASKNGW